MPPANKPVPDPEIAARVPPLKADRQGERRTMTMRVAILDDYLNVARELADWDRLEGKVEVTALTEAFADEDAAAKALADFDIVVAMRERTRLPASLLERLPKLKLIVTRSEERRVGKEWVSKGRTRWEP